MPGAEIPPLATEPEFCVVSRRNDSLGSRRRWWVFAVLCLVSFSLGLGWAALGAWLVLPYSALEMAVLYLAFRWIERHATDWERVCVCGDRVIVERQQAGVRVRQEFNRYWARVEVEAGTGHRSPRLKLCYAGREVRIGEDLPVAQRTLVASDLHRVLAVR
jgi:uncharacterized membrane protein